MHTSSSVTEVIGSGHFGEVSRGLWKSAKKDSMLNVALKTLSQSRKPEDKIKLLQEAVIMGQFSHPNVVQLFGIVSYGEPVSSVHVCVHACMHGLSHYIKPINPVRHA
jgi:serine/threonine protein kinase